jgi:uncharacterized membrane protein
MFLTQGFAFGQYQIRSATAIYALAYIHPIFIITGFLGNLVSNIMFGGLGFMDWIGGAIAGAVACILCWLSSKAKMPYLVIPSIILIPGMLVPLWLTVIINVPYWVLVGSISAGQIVPAVLGYFLIKSKAIRF